MQSSRVLAVCFLTLAALCGAQKQQRRAAPAPRVINPVLQLLQEKEVEVDLELTKEQIKEVAKAELESRRRMRERSEKRLRPPEREKLQTEHRRLDEEAAAKILKPNQQKRLNQIRLQIEGPTVFSDADVSRQTETYRSANGRNQADPGKESQ